MRTWTILSLCLALSACCDVAMCFGSADLTFDPPITTPGFYTVLIVDEDGNSPDRTCELTLTDDGPAVLGDVCEGMRPSGDVEGAGIRELELAGPSERTRLQVQHEDDGVIIDQELDLNYDHDVRAAGQAGGCATACPTATGWVAWGG